jgi:hypothetical protein
MFKKEDKVYYRGSIENKKVYRALTTIIIELVHTDTKMALIKHTDGFDINEYIDSGLVGEKYRDSGINVLLVSENTLEKIL